jgi:hypothetical protein
LLARTLGLCFPLIKTELGRKNCIFVATNQLTIDPMCKFGNPERESGGTAMEYYPDSRTRLFVSRSQKNIEEEPHISGDGLDRYFPGTATIKKNKFGPMNRSTTFRLWADEKGDAGRGIDPVYDLYNFYDMIGKVETTRAPKTRELTLRFLFDEFQGETYLWTDFKRRVLTDDGFAMALQLKADTMLRDGTAQSSYYDAAKDISMKKETKGASGADKKDSEVVEV